MKRIFQKSFAILLSVVMIFSCVSFFSAIKAEAVSDLLWPVPASYKMKRGFTGANAHNGIDISNCSGENIIAAYDGTVYAYYNKCQHISASCTSCDSYGYGVGLIIKHNIGGTTYYTHYGHMLYNSIPTKYATKGTTVKKGDFIGIVGSSGNSTGPHLHFTVSTGTSHAWQTYIDNNPTDSRHNITSTSGISYVYESTEHTHNYNTYAYFGAVHPHHSYYSCSCGDTKVNYDTTNFYDSCVQCNPSAFCANLGDEFYGTILNSACWKPISKTEGTDNITLETETGTAKQKWKFERQSDGAYVISSCCDGTVLEMTDGIRENDTQLSAHNDYWGGYYQQWYLIPQGSGVIFLSKHYTEEQWVMDLFENDTSDGNSITIQPRNNTDAQIWNVYQAGDVQLRPADFSVTVDQDKATFKWNAIYGALGYDVKIYNDDVYMNQVDVESGYSIELPAGTYSAYVDSKDYYEYVMSNVVTFTISDKIPEKPVITSVTSDDSGMVTVKWTECERAECYSLRFYKSGEHYKSLIGVTKDTVYWYELPNGTYTVKVTAEGDGCWKDSEMSAEFTVSQKIPDEPAFSATCTQCGEAFTDADLYNAHVAGHATDNPEYNFTLEVRNPSTTTISYGDAIILHADVTVTLPAGATIKWTASNGNFSCFVSSDGTTCTISPKLSGETTFTATVVDANGNIISSDEQIMTSKAGFFDKIIAFFKGLFGLTKTIPQALKGNF